jgi:hypothetical protein
MTDWRQRLASAGAPDARLERELRYRFCAPLIRDAAVWLDLGGDPAAAAAALAHDDARPKRTVLAGGDAGGASELGPQAEHVEADLTDPQDLQRVRQALVAADDDGARVVTCLTALETLSTFAPLVDLLVELAEQDRATVVLAVPDVAGATALPEQPPVWDAGAVEELRRLLPADHVLARQVALHGSAIGLVEGGPARHDLQVDVDPREQTPTHVLAIFGPQATAPAATATVETADPSARRAHERGLEAEAALGRTLLAERA